MLDEFREHHSGLYHHRQFNCGLQFSPPNPPGQLLEERVERQKPDGKKLDPVVIENQNGKVEDS